MRRQISVLVAVVSTAIVASFVIPLLLLVQTLAADRGMAVASQQAGTVAVVLSSLHDDPDVRAVLEPSLTDSAAATSVVLADGATFGAAWPSVGDDPEYQRARSGEAFSVRDSAGGRVYVPVLVDGGVAVVRAQLSPAQLAEGVPRAWTSIILLGLALAAAAILVAAQLGDRVSRPVLAVAETAHRLRAGELHTRAPVGGPAETREVAQALNGLADRIDELLRLERESVGGLAHRLRTPLTALRLEAEGLPAGESRTELERQIGVLQGAIDDLVREARRPVRDDLPGDCDAAAVTASRVAHWLPLAEDQGRLLQLTAPTGAARVGLGDAELSDLIDICIDNVFAHTPEGVGLQITVATAAGRTTLTFADDGPGFPAGPAASRPGTSGFGLQIVARTLARIGGRLTTSAPGLAGGRVELEFPTAGSE